MKPEHLHLKQATADLIKGVGGVEYAATVCRVGKSTLSDAQNHGKPDNFLAVDVIFDLEPLSRERSGWPHVTRALCAANGGMFVPLPDGPVTREDLLMLLARKARESGELTEAAIACCSAVDDNPAQRREAARNAIKELDEVVAVALEMRVALKTIEGEN
ncbi:MAG: phage regulatory CII family protein [Sphingomonas parapaucimobilis]